MILDVPNDRIQTHFKLVSLWDMYRLNSARFLHLMANLHELTGLMLPSEGLFSPGSVKITIDDHMRAEAREIADLLGSMELTVAHRAAERFAQSFSATSIDSRTGVERIRALSAVITDQLSDRHLFVLNEAQAGLYAQPLPFGDGVFKCFPSANEDIAEAAKCLALERSTACVMHLMRAAEVGLKCLAKKLKVGPQNDWGQYLKGIDKALTIAPPTTPAKSTRAANKRQQFLAEASAEFRNLKRAWRNPTMHVARTYTPERALEIFVAMKAFMGHLATRLHE